MALHEPPPREKATLLLLCLHVAKKIPADVADLAARHVHRDPFELAFYLSEFAPGDFQVFLEEADPTLEQALGQVRKKYSVALNAAVKELLLIPEPPKNRYVVTQTTYTEMRSWVEMAYTFHVFLTWLRNNKNTAAAMEPELTILSNNLLTIGHCFCFLCNKHRMFHDSCRLLFHYAYEFRFQNRQFSKMRL